MSDRFVIGQTYDFEFAPGSKTVGIDRYTLYSFSGVKKEWASYTFTTEQPGSYARWWLSDEPTGLYRWLSCETPPEGAVDLNESGLCILKVEGNSLFASPYSSVLVYRKDSELSCAEVFDGSTDVLYMSGQKIG